MKHQDEVLDGLQLEQSRQRLAVEKVYSVYLYGGRCASAAALREGKLLLLSLKLQKTFQFADTLYILQNLERVLGYLNLKHFLIHLRNEVKLITTFT